jgi:hypothetical protein
MSLLNLASQIRFVSKGSLINCATVLSEHSRLKIGQSAWEEKVARGGAIGQDIWEILTFIYNNLILS